MPLPNVINIVLWSGYLDVVDRSNYCMTCVQAAEKLLTTESILEGISHSPAYPHHRFNFWKWAIGRELDYSIFEPLHGGDMLGYYLHHRALLTSTITKKTSGQLGEIMRDVGRTFPEHPFFSSKNGQPGEILLARILCATLSSTPNIGYCQGMNFVVGTMLLARIPQEMMEESYQESAETRNERVEDTENVEGAEDISLATVSSLEHANISHYDEMEADVFWMFQSILIKNDKGLEMEFIWKPTFPKMKLRVYQFDRLLELYLPAVHAHFESMHLSPEVVISQWFMTLFSNTIPAPYTYYIWDYVFVSNWPGIFRITLAILYVLQEKLIEMDLEEVGLLIRDWKRGKFDIPVSFSELLCSAETFPIDLTSLTLLQENYAIEMIAAAIGDQLDATSSVGRSYHGGCMGLPRPGGDSWLRRYGEFPNEMRGEMLTIHNEINEMSIQVDRDKAVLQNKILKACELCETAYDDLDKAIREEMQWLQYTSHLKHDLSSWEKKAKTALAELKWQNENEKKVSVSNSYEEEDESDSDDSDSDYSRSSGSSSGEYIDEEGSCSDEDYSDSDESDSDSEEVTDSDSPTPQGTGGGFFFDAVTNMTNMLIPNSANSQPSTSSNGKNKVEISHDENYSETQSFQNHGAILESTMPQQTEYDDGMRQQKSNGSSSTNSHTSSPSSSPEMNKLPLSNAADSLAEKIKAHPARRRTSSVPGLKQGVSPAASPETTQPTTTTTAITSIPLSLDSVNLKDDVNAEATVSGTNTMPTTSADTVEASISITTNSPQSQEIRSLDSNGSKSPNSPSKFQNFKSNILGKGKNSDNGGGRIGFSRRYITSKLERRKAKIQKAKECHFLHKRIIKSSKEVEIAKKKLAKAKESKEVALIADEEAKEWKESLCEQYQQLVKDADHIKSQKLIYIVDTYGM
mmetsp:Transcript_6572/g.10739  ORF Transcript_6572/g.10739 Transcript_6572/m.10739 type:complete len:917 (+) Transcript_6572:95-2845(+)